MLKARIRAGRRLDDLPYRAPELQDGGEAVCAADVYALGVIMYEVLKQELVVADIAVKADLEGMDDERTLQQFVDLVGQGERYVPFSTLPNAHEREKRRELQACSRCHR